MKAAQTKNVIAKYHIIMNTVTNSTIIWFDVLLMWHFTMCECVVLQMWFCAKTFSNTLCTLCSNAKMLHFYHYPLPSCGLLTLVKSNTLSTLWEPALSLIIWIKNRPMRAHRHRDLFDLWNSDFEFLISIGRNYVLILVWFRELITYRGRITMPVLFCL